MSAEKAPRIKKRGSRQEVLDGLAQLTSGGLSAADLVFNERTGKICTKKEIERGIELSLKMKKQPQQPTDVIKLKKPRAKKIKPETVESQPADVAVEN